MTTHSILDPIDATTKAVDVLLTAIDGALAVGAVTAYKAALARHGRNLVDQAGPEALATVLARIRDEAPDATAAQDCERLLLLAWEGIIASKDRAA